MQPQEIARKLEDSLREEEEAEAKAVPTPRRPGRWALQMAAKVVEAEREELLGKRKRAEWVWGLNLTVPH